MRPDMAETGSTCSDQPNTTCFNPMPIYEYQCSACGHELEAMQKMSDDALVHCPECHGKTLRKKISAAGFQLKGTGWYETDFKNSGKPSQASTSGAGAAAPSAGGSCPAAAGGKAKNKSEAA